MADVTKADLLRALAPYPDDATLNVSINQQDIHEVDALRVDEHPTYPEPKKILIDITVS
jgi:hypothetical protein